MAAKQIVVGFPTYEYSLDFLGALTDRQKYEYALDMNEAVIYDCVDDFFNELNNDYVDTENMYWFNINV